MIWRLSMEPILHFGAVIHIISMGGLVIFGLHRLWLLFCWFKIRNIQNGTAGNVDPAAVTIQIPLYNESRVAARIIDAAANIRWPSHLKEIQILDDSTDQTRQIVDERAAFWAGRQTPIRVIRRRRRRGFKAGALASGLGHVRGEFIAIFDADFIPPPDFLEKTLPHFSDPDVGMVQTRWGFLNAAYSWLTRIQSILLSSHFRIEHHVRFSRSLFFNFNGTAGVWRKRAITSSGGWQSDTVTEDLDLSYRAQLAGWRFIYLDSVTVPSELPITLSDFRGQQQRWSKGSIQTARKILPLIFRSNVSFPIKMESAAHLLANFCWLFGFLATLTLYPLILYRSGIGPCQILKVDVPVFIFSGGAFLVYFLVFAISEKQTKGIWLIPFLPAFSIGLAPALALSVMKGFFISGGRFIRTPKFGITENSDPQISVTGKLGQSTVYLIINLLCICYTFSPVSLAFHRETWLALPFLLQFPLGFFVITWREINETLEFSPINKIRSHRKNN